MPRPSRGQVAEVLFRVTGLRDRQREQHDSQSSNSRCVASTRSSWRSRRCSQRHRSRACGRASSPVPFGSTGALRQRLRVDSRSRSQSPWRSVAHQRRPQVLAGAVALVVPEPPAVPHVAEPAGPRSASCSPAARRTVRASAPAGRSRRSSWASASRTRPARGRAGAGPPARSPPPRALGRSRPRSQARSGYGGPSPGGTAGVVDCTAPMSQAAPLSRRLPTASRVEDRVPVDVRRRAAGRRAAGRAASPLQAPLGIRPRTGLPRQRASARTR